MSRWITQEDLDKMLNESFSRGAGAMRMAAKRAAYAEAMVAMEEVRGCYCAVSIANEIEKIPAPKNETP